MSFEHQLVAVAESAAVRTLALHVIGAVLDQADTGRATVDQLQTAKDLALALAVVLEREREAPRRPRRRPVVVRP